MSNFEKDNHKIRLLFEQSKYLNSYFNSNNKENSFKNGDIKVKEINFISKKSEYELINTVIEDGFLSEIYVFRLKNFKLNSINQLKIVPIFSVEDGNLDNFLIESIKTRSFAGNGYNYQYFKRLINENNEEEYELYYFIYTGFGDPSLVEYQINFKLILYYINEGLNYELRKTK